MCVVANEIVKYGNELNAVPFRKFKPNEMNLFFSIVSRMRNKGLDEVEFSFEQLRDLSHYTGRSGRFVQDLENTYHKMLSLNLYHEDEQTYEAWVLFTGFRISKVEKTVSISVNPKLKGVLNDIANWTRYSLQQFNDLKSAYAKTMFRLLKQYRTTGKLKLTMDKFRVLLDVPKSYTADMITRRVLKPIEEELSTIFNDFSVQKVKKGRGGKIVAYVFTFVPEARDKPEFEPVQIDEPAVKTKDAGDGDTKDYDQIRKELTQAGTQVSTKQQYQHVVSQYEQAIKDADAEMQTILKYDLDKFIELTGKKFSKIKY